MWKVTLSKSETIWSMETGGALEQVLVRWLRGKWWEGKENRELTVPREALCEEGLNEDVLVIEEEHSAGVGEAGFYGALVVVMRWLSMRSHSLMSDSFLRYCRGLVAAAWGMQAADLRATLAADIEKVARHPTL